MVEYWNDGRKRMLRVAGFGLRVQRIKGPGTRMLEVNDLRERKNGMME